jgi:hypothetical protein
VTLREFEQVLGARSASSTTRASCCSDAFNEASDGVTLKAVDGIWYNTTSDFEPDGDFLQRNADYFDAAPSLLIFQEIDRRRHQRLHPREYDGLIEKMLETLGDDAVMSLSTRCISRGCGGIV